MPSYIPHLAQIATRAQRHGAKRGSAMARGARGRAALAVRLNVEHLAGLVPVLRRRLAIASTFSDAAILASLTAIASRPNDEQRWRAAKASTLGLFLTSRNGDISAALVTILGLLPKAYH